MSGDILDPLTSTERGLLSELQAVRAERDQLKVLVEKLRQENQALALENLTLLGQQQGDYQ